MDVLLVTDPAFILVYLHEQLKEIIQLMSNHMVPRKNLDLVFFDGHFLLETCAGELKLQ